jgi:hypothetical protein
MAITVSDEVLKLTTKCQKGFGCLLDRLRDCCKVTITAETQMIMTFCRTNGDCPYCDPINDFEGFCICPTRIELFNRHGI